MRKKNRKREEQLNAASHGLGALLSVAALAGLWGRAADGFALASLLVFGLSLLLLYSASAIYHAVSGFKWKRRLQRVDHLCIYILIAGTYTPVVLLGLDGALGWWLFAGIWSLAAIGFWFKFSRWRRNEKLSLALYALMGWFIVLAIVPVVRELEAGLLWALLAGGLFYTLGIYFFANDRKPYYHAIWHLFVLAGSASHFIGIFTYLP